MNKQKNLLLILIFLVFFIINYIIYKFYFLNKITELHDQKKYYSELKNKVDNIKEEKIKLEKLKKDNEQLKRNLQTLDNIAPKQIDTPQLAYDFYTSCLQYKVKGEELKFDLGEDKKNEQEKTDSSQTNQKESPKTKDKDFQKLTITLKISGNRSNVEQYLRNLQGITKRQLNIKSITLGEMDRKEEENTTKNLDINSNEDNLNKSKTVQSSYDNIKKYITTKLDKKSSSIKSMVGTNNGEKVADGMLINSSEIENDKAVDNAEKDNVEKDNKNINNGEKNNNIYNEKPLNTDEISAEIIFYQYIQGTGKEFNVDKNYDFYDKSIGFDSIADMFKKK